MVVACSRRGVRANDPDAQERSGLSSLRGLNADGHGTLEKLNSGGREMGDPAEADLAFGHSNLRVSDGRALANRKQGF